MITFIMFMMWRKNSCASCCRFEENPGCPRPTNVLNIRGGIPCRDSCSLFVSDGSEYLPESKPIPSLALQYQSCILKLFTCCNFTYI